MKENMDISVIIVSCNTCEYTVRCVESIIEKTCGIAYEIIISDNGSSDGTCEMITDLFPSVRLIENKENYGFGKANNIAKEQARGKYILYLNSDTILLNNAIKEFYDYFEKNDNGDLGCIGCYLVDGDGKPSASAGKYIKPFKTLLTFLHMILAPNDFFQKGTSLEVSGTEKVLDNGFIIGADMFLKNDDKAAFDEGYFMYAEEMDLQYNNFYQKKKKCVLIDQPKIVHYGGISNTDYNMDIFQRASIRWLWISNLIYLKKNCNRSKIVITIIKSVLLKKMNKYGVSETLEIQKKKLGEL